jgi:hypothetical protein
MSDPCPAATRAMTSRLRLAWWWTRGLLVCYGQHSGGTAFRKRRPGHPGRHRTGNGQLRWKRGPAGIT